MMTPFWKSCADGSLEGSFPAAGGVAIIITADFPLRRRPTTKSGEDAAKAGGTVATAAGRAGVAAEAACSHPATYACSSSR